MVFQIKKYRVSQFIKDMEELKIEYEIDYQSLDRGNFDVLIDDNNPVKNEVALRLEEWQS